MSNPGPLDWKCKQLSRNFLEVNIPCVRNESWEHWALLLADVHIDSVKCDREALKETLDRAVDRRASIYIFGDLFDVMQGKYDPRSSKQEINPKYVHPERGYIDLVVEDAVNFFKPYASNIALVGQGNHETSIFKRLEIDLISLFVGGLRAVPTYAQTGGYAGNVRFQFNRSDSGYVGKKFKSTELAYHHGSAIGTDAKRLAFAAEYPDSQILVTGHYHKERKYPLYVERTTHDGRRYRQKRQIICLGTPKDDRGDSYGGYATEKFFSLTMPSFQWVRWYHERRPEHDVKFELREV